MLHTFHIARYCWNPSIPSWFRNSSPKRPLNFKGLARVLLIQILALHWTSLVFWRGLSIIVWAVAILQTITLSEVSSNNPNFPINFIFSILIGTQLAVTLPGLQNIRHLIAPTIIYMSLPLHLCKQWSLRIWDLVDSFTFKAQNPPTFVKLFHPRRCLNSKRSNQSTVW